MRKLVQHGSMGEVLCSFGADSKYDRTNIATRINWMMQCEDIRVRVYIVNGLGKIAIPVLLHHGVLIIEVSSKILAIRCDYYAIDNILLLRYFSHVLIQQ